LWYNDLRRPSLSIAAPNWKAISITTASPTSFFKTRAAAKLDLGNEREQR
jgi:hypothetical protein